MSLTSHTHKCYNQRAHSRTASLMYATRNTFTHTNVTHTPHTHMHVRQHCHPLLAAYQDCSSMLPPILLSMLLSHTACCLLRLFKHASLHTSSMLQRFLSMLSSTTENASAIKKSAFLKKTKKLPPTKAFGQVRPPDRLGLPYSDSPDCQKRTAPATRVKVECPVEPCHADCSSPCAAGAARWLGVV